MAKAKKRNEIRITDVPEPTLKKVKASAKKNKRTIAKESLMIIERGL